MHKYVSDSAQQVTVLTTYTNHCPVGILACATNWGSRVYQAGRVEQRDATELHYKRRIQRLTDGR